MSYNFGDISSGIEAIFSTTTVGIDDQPVHIDINSLNENGMMHQAIFSLDSNGIRNIDLSILCVFFAIPSILGY